MKQYKNFGKIFIFVASSAIFFTACKKATSVDEIGDRGQTFVKILGGGQPDFVDGGEPEVKAFNVDFIPTAQTFAAVDVRRDAANSGELSKTMIVTVKDDTTALRVYSDSLVAQGGTALVYLPSTYYTIGSATPKVGGDGGSFTLTFAAGEFAKEISLTLADATVLDPSTKYGLEFTITSADAGGVVSYMRSIVVTIGAKNQYDGTYDDNFKNYHPTSNPGYTGDDVTVEMWTSGANSVKIWDPLFGDFANPAVLAGTTTAFGGQEPEYTVNPATNKVTVQNTFPASPTQYTMNPLFDSHYDPATRTFFVKWGYSYVGGQFALGASREWTQTLKYLGPR